MQQECAQSSCVQPGHLRMLENCTSLAAGRTRAPHLQTLRGADLQSCSITHCFVVMGPLSSMGSPMTFMILPKVSGPTGIRMGAPESSTFCPLTRPSVPSIAIVRTVFSPAKAQGQRYRSALKLTLQDSCCHLLPALPRWRSAGGRTARSGAKEQKEQKKHQ